VDRTTGALIPIASPLGSPPFALFPFLAVLRNHVVEIDVRRAPPASPVNPSSRGLLSVALFGSGAVPVERIDPSSLLLGPGQARARQARRRDLDRDGIADLELRFRTEDAGIANGDREVCLEGETRGTERLLGCAAIRTVPN
jgi:hypothetical protein